MCDRRPLARAPLTAASGAALLMGNQEMRAKPDTNFDFLRGFFGKGGSRNRSMPTPLSFEMPDVNHTFRRGHRIMVQVQSSWFPLAGVSPSRDVNGNAPEPQFQRGLITVHSVGKGQRIPFGINGCVYGGVQNCEHCFRILPAVRLRAQVFSSQLEYIHPGLHFCWQCPGEGNAIVKQLEHTARAAPTPRNSSRSSSFRR